MNKWVWKFNVGDYIDMNYNGVEKGYYIDDDVDVDNKMLKIVGRNMIGHRAHYKVQQMSGYTGIFLAVVLEPRSRLNQKMYRKEKLERIING